MRCGIFETLCAEVSFRGKMVGVVVFYEFVVCCLLSFLFFIFEVGGFWRLLLWPCRRGLSNRATRMVRGLEPEVGYKAGFRRFD